MQIHIDNFLLHEMMVLNTDLILLWVNFPERYSFRHIPCYEELLTKKLHVENSIVWDAKGFWPGMIFSQQNFSRVGTC